jgi:ceramide glucosyltransferase
MTSLPAKILEHIAALGAGCATVYYLLGIWSARSFLRDARGTRPDRKFTPPISILKPLKGMDPELYDSLRSHCLQEYPNFEIVFGVSDPGDPAIAIVRKLQSDFPNCSIALLVCDEELGTNTKVSNLAQMLRVARHGYLIVNDGDIRVPADYLRRVISPLADARVGLVTCLYRGVAATSLGSQLESLGISTDFAPGVLTARLLERGIRFGLGSTLCFRRADLLSIGGFEGFADYLADDYELGCRLSGRGLTVQLSPVIVDTFLPHYTFTEFIVHQLRWARTIRDARSAGYLGLILTFGIPWALLAFVASNAAPWSWGLLAVTFAARLWLALIVGLAVLKDHHLRRFLWLLPVRDLIAVVTWFASLFGHSIRWGGEKFELKDGRLLRSQQKS